MIGDEPTDKLSTNHNVRIKRYPNEVAEWSKHSVRAYKSDPAGITVQLRGGQGYASVCLSKARVLWLAKALTDLAETIRDETQS